MFILEIVDWFGRMVERIRPPHHPSTMSSDAIASELGRVWAKPYSRRNQRRAALLLDFDGKAEFSGLPSEDVFETIVGFAMKTSLLIGGKSTTLQHSYASMMLYRICIISSSITGVYKQHERVPEATLDYGSIAVLCRTLFDASIMYWYLTETISDDEWAFRLAVLRVHDCAARVRLFKGLDSDEAENQRKNLNLLKQELSNLVLFKARSVEEQGKLLSGQVLYVNGMRSMLKDMNIGKKYFDGLYNYLSAHVHLTPLSYFRARSQSDTADDIVFARGFMQLCLHEASRIVVRVVIREIELSKLEDNFERSSLDKMRRFGATPMGAS
jgi:hypothetical protein